MEEKRRTFKLKERMSMDQIELSLKDGRGRSVRLEDNPNIPVSFCAPFMLYVNHQFIGFFRDAEDILEVNSNSLSYDKELLNDILAISWEIREMKNSTIELLGKPLNANNDDAPPT